MEILILFNTLSYSVAPSAPPSSVVVTGVTSSTISVQWGKVPCIHHNGDITGYSVQYGITGSGNIQTMDIMGTSGTGTTLSNLMPSTAYFIKVAAVNGAGTGVYSELLVNQTTSSEKLDCLCNNTI